MKTPPIAECSIAAKNHAGHPAQQIPAGAAGSFTRCPLPMVCICRSTGSQLPSARHPWAVLQGRSKSFFHRLSGREPPGIREQPQPLVVGVSDELLQTSGLSGRNGQLPVPMPYLPGATDGLKQQQLAGIWPGRSRLGRRSFCRWSVIGTWAASGHFMATRGDYAGSGRPFLAVGSSCRRITGFIY